MVKSFKCPGCGATVEYDPQSGMMHCEYCNCDYEPSEIGRQAISGASHEATQEEKNMARKQAMIKMNIAVCNSCGAELAVNAVEVSSFCPYCGNASVVMDRVEERLAPDYVIPFKVTKEKAESIIRERFNSGFFVPKEVKHFELDRLCGVYVPFWTYDLFYGADQRWQYQQRSNSGTQTYYTRMVNDCTYHNLTVDASERFLDASSQRLEPFDMSEQKEFDASYLSGFYSDRFDVGFQEADRVAVNRAEDIFNEAVKEEVGKRKATLAVHHPRSAILGRNYVLLPVWFLTFRYKDLPYTILVNGQTEKMVGAVPFNKKKALMTFLVLAMAIITPLIFIGGNLFEALMGLGTEVGIRSLAYLFYWFIGMSIIWHFIIRTYRDMKKSIKLSRSASNNTLAKERQEKV